MKLHSFRIKNYKSIYDSGWCVLSPDNVTVYIGQNEAGKTAILEALNSFETDVIQEAALRTDGSFPEITLAYRTSRQELESIFSDAPLRPDEWKRLEELDWIIRLCSRWNPTKLDESESFVLDDEGLNNALNMPRDDQSSLSDGMEPAEETQTDSTEEDELGYVERRSNFVGMIWKRSPNIISFDENQGLLPGIMDVEELLNAPPKAKGVIATRNFLSIAGIDSAKLKLLMKSGMRVTDTQLEKASEKVTLKLQQFWRQKIGSTKRIKLRCEMKFYSSDIPEKTGKPYLTFWIVDELERLHPEQRSRGVRWFVSFFLQLLDSALNAKDSGDIYLLDEPGGSLHMKAQEDVLAVIESIKGNVQVIYTTHSPYMISNENIHRINAVQRIDEKDETSPTQIISALRLSSASRETLSPLFTVMGVSFANQNVVKEKRNIILEELSALYYLKAFERLSALNLECSYIPATGVGNIPLLVNLFLGWGIKFSVILDDEGNGRGVYNKLKRNLYGDSDEETRKHLHKIRDCVGIEDLFSVDDFKYFVLGDRAIDYGERKRNSDYVNNETSSKVILALNFRNAVNEGRVNLADLSSETKDRISELMQRAGELLEQQ